MKKSIIKYGRILAVAVFVLVAGCCYSCGLRKDADSVLLAREEASAHEGMPDGKGTSAGEGVPDGKGTSAHEGMPDGGEMSASGGASDGKGMSASDGASVREETGRPEAVPESMETGSNGSSGAGGWTELTETVCYVYVCGEVERPGVYQMKDGQRIYEAIGLAGGFTEAAAEAYLNLAAPVKDGMKITVPDQEQADEMERASGGPGAAGVQPEGLYGPGVSGGGPRDAQAADGGTQKVNLNTAGREELMTLKGIGEARAEDILAYRQEHGAFDSIEEIMEVPGIKEAAFRKIKDDITVGR